MLPKQFEDARWDWGADSKKRMKQAANDPRFMTDLEESMEAFSELDAEAGDVTK